MSNRKKISTIGLLTILAILLICQNSVIANSVYAIPDHWGPEEATLNVYDVLEGSDEGKLAYRPFSGRLSVILADFRFILDMVRKIEYN